MENTVSVSVVIVSVGGILLGVLLTLLWQDYHRNKQHSTMPARLQTQRFREEWHVLQERLGCDITWQEANMILRLEKLISAERQQDIVFSLRVLASDDIADAPERVQLRLARLKHLIATGGLVGDTEV